MRAFSLLVLVFSLLALAFAPPVEARSKARKHYAAVSGTVVAVADGDTLTVVNKRARRIIIRLAEIDAPEKCQPYGGQARKLLTELALHRAVKVEVIDIDQYGRRVGKVSVDGAAETVNRILLRRGLAWVYTAYAKDATLKPLERQAAAARLGLWADKHPQPPWQWRKIHGFRTPCVMQQNRKT
jgi:endonuclease YncB( thermonuclease family)